MFFYYSFCFFFFSSRRRHTRWPRDWSSDVCSSDLFLVLLVVVSLDDIANHGAGSLAAVLSAFLHQDGYDDLRVAARGVTDKRSEERRVGKECRSRWATYDERKKMEDYRVDGSLVVQ